MRPRIEGSYRFKQGINSKDVGISPILALACEGHTEAIYCRFLARRRLIRVKPKVFKGRHGEHLIDDALEYANFVTSLNPDAVVIPAVIYDLEAVSNQALKKATDAVKYAKRKKINIWVNVPVIERWFILHKKSFSINRSKKAVLNELVRMTRSSGQAYKKPGTAPFFVDLVGSTDSALARCNSSHPVYITDLSLPCMCNLVKFLQEY